MSQQITPDMILRAYMRGAFPMAEPGTDTVRWFTTDRRAIVPLDDSFHVPKTLKRTVNKGMFDIRSDTAFTRVLEECAHDRNPENRTWISPSIIAAYATLHQQGRAHSVEAWRDGKLVGGLYGVALGGAFFGESMFCRPELGGTDASKVCLVSLVARLRAGGFVLCDSQYSNDHMQQFGVREMAGEEYLRLLESALTQTGTWS